VGLSAVSVFMVIPGGRWSPDCSARATAQRGQQRTAGLIPDWLKFPTLLRLHAASARRETCGRRKSAKIAVAIQPNAVN
jgi:hypothetical protein